jgi:hypothetical protein
MSLKKNEEKDSLNRIVRLRAAVFLIGFSLLSVHSARLPTSLTGSTDALPKSISRRQTVSTIAAFADA